MKRGFSKKKIFLTLSLIASQICYSILGGSANAQSFEIDGESPESRVEAPLAEDPKNEVNAIDEALLLSYLNELIQIVNADQNQHETSFSLGGVTVADACQTLMNSDLFIGEIGKSVYREFIGKYTLFPRLLSGGNVQRICPRYSKMSLKEKATLWTLIVTVMAHFESSCSPEAKNKGPNGMALGLLQLHSGKEDKYDGEFNTCDKNASSSTSGTLKCALGMLETQLERTNGNLFDPKSYWDVLRPRGRARKADDIQRAIQGSSLCNPKGI